MSIAQADGEAKARLMVFLEKRGPKATLIDEFAKAMPGAIRETNSTSGAPLRPVRLGAPGAVLDKRADGTIHIRAAQSLGGYHGKLSEPTSTIGPKAAPDRLFLAQRDAQDQWRKRPTPRRPRRRTAYRSRIAAQRGLSAERPLVVLSGNDIEHALLALGAMYVGRPSMR